MQKFDVSDHNYIAFLNIYQLISQKFLSFLYLETLGHITVTQIPQSKLEFTFAVHSVALSKYTRACIHANAIPAYFGRCFSFY